MVCQAFQDPSQGVGKITDINEQIFREQTMLYYNIYIEASDMVVMVPVERAEDLGIRAIVSASEAEKAKMKFRLRRGNRSKKSKR